MKDQNTVNTTEETHVDRRLRGLDLFTESVLKPDPSLRDCARNQGCYDELMQVRDYVIAHLQDLRKYYEDSHKSV